MKRVLLWSALWFVAVFLLSLAFLTYTREPTITVDATPACAPQPNPCAVMSCKPRPERNLA